MKRAAVTGAIGFAAAAALLVVPGATWGRFSDVAITPNNTIEAGTLELGTGGGTGADHLDFRFDNLLPGVPQAVSGTYRNVGRLPQDVWIVVDEPAPPNGEIHVTSNGRETPLPSLLKLADNLQPGAVGTFGLSFSYNPRFSENPTAPAEWRLAYRIVATQDGVTPIR